jgi:toxin ParE1/3/4
MKNSFRVSARAGADLDEIWLYIAQNNPDAADKLIAELASRFPKLASMPLMGRLREELSSGLRSFTVGKYIVFYRRNKDGVDIVRVLHGARNFPPLFE